MVLIYKNRKQDEKEHLLEIQAFVSEVTVLELFIHVTIKISLTGRKTVSNTEKNGTLNMFLALTFMRKLYTLRSHKHKKISIYSTGI